MEGDDYGMFGFIYITTHLPSGIRYLGRCRYSRHNWRSYLGSGAALKRQIAKDGPTAFRREIIEEHPDLQSLEKAEARLLLYHEATTSPEWFNIHFKTNSTRGSTGHSHTSEYRAAAAKRMLGTKRPQSVRDALRAANKGKRRSKESRQKQSAAISGSRHHRALPVTVDDTTYETITSACAATGLSYHRVRLLALEQNKGR